MYTADGKENNEGFKIRLSTVVVTLLCNFLLDNLLSKGAIATALFFIDISVFNIVFGACVYNT